MSCSYGPALHSAACCYLISPKPGEIFDFSNMLMLPIVVSELAIE